MGRRGFVRLVYTDQTAADVDNADFDNDGLTNYQEINGYNGFLSHPLDEDTDHDGTADGLEALAGNNPADPNVGGPPLKPTFETKSIEAIVFNQLYVSGHHAALVWNATGDSSVGPEWTTGQPEFELFADQPPTPTYGRTADIAYSFPLPGEWSPVLRGAWWKSSEIPAEENPDGIPLYSFTASRIEHRLKLNRKASPLGFSYPLQVLKVPWTIGDPWTISGPAESIITEMVVPPGELLSNIAIYDNIVGLVANQAVGLHTVRFEEVEPESGFDDEVRYLEAQRLQIPWLVVANSTEAATPPNAQVKLHLSPVGGGELPLSISVPAGYSATVTPEKVTGKNEPFTLSIQGNAVFPEDRNSCEGTLRIAGQDVLKLVFYKRREVNLAIHKITLTNDDEELPYLKVSGEPLEPIKKGEGKPNTVCVRKVASTFDTIVVGGDDVGDFGVVRTGKNGICETERAGDDEQVIKVGKGEKNAVIINPGPNGVANTGVDPGDDVSGQNITTGEDGIRDTATPKPRQTPVNVPTKEELKNYLDRTFGPQTNVWFNIIEWNEKDVAFDTICTFPGGQSLKPNHIFDYNGATPAKTSEEDLIENASFNSSNNTFNLYYIGSQISSTGGKDCPAGFARSHLRRPYIAAFDRNLHVSKPQTQTFMLLGASAHELAHNDLFSTNTSGRGLHHPWMPDLPDIRTVNSFYHEANFEVIDKLIPYRPTRNHTLLDQQNNRKSLMWYVYPEEKNPATGRFPSKIIKQEADIIHELNPP